MDKDIEKKKEYYKIIISELKDNPNKLLCKVFIADFILRM